MATQPVPVAGEGPRREPAGWHAYYLVYHGDRNRLLRGLVRPLLGELLRRREVDRFFFVRYALGGPHLRLRWRATGEAAAAAAEAALARAAEAFFARWPSLGTLPDEQVRAANRPLLVDSMAPPGHDPVYPDNSWRRVAVELEVERYGGPEHLEPSLDLFTLSSAFVLRVLTGEEAATDRTRREGLRALLHAAWGFAGHDEHAFAGLAGYGPRLMGRGFESCVRAGDAVFRKRRPQLVDMVARELARLEATDGSSLDAGGLGAAASRLADRVEGLPAARRWRLAASHIHMTANRLGLTNAEEVYLSEMLRLAVEALVRESPETWKRLWRGRPRFASGARRRPLGDSVASALAELANEGRT
jgi:hypothetical protein